MSQSRVRQTRAARPTTLHLERWVSWLFGQLWECRDNVSADHPEGFELALGRQIVEDFAAVGGRDGTSL